MSEPSEWTNPAELRQMLVRLWGRGEILRARLAGEPLFPKTLRLRRPASRDLAPRFSEVQAWIRALAEGSKEQRGFGYEIVWREVGHRDLGAQRLPFEVVVPSEADALKLLGKQRECERFTALASMTLEAQPRLREWILRRPLALLEYEEEWERLLSAVGWFAEHPRPGLYLRQVDAPGVHTKLLERRAGLIAELLGQVLPSEAITGDEPDFEGRFGLRRKPALIRLRLLDPSLDIGGLRDVTAPVEEIARLHLPIERAFVTENDTNALSFPDVPAAVVFFGSGYALELLASIEWLRCVHVHYWGDLDTHGFVMLGRFRAAFPSAHSLLMDRPTLMQHRPHWGREEPQQRHLADVPGLTPDEQSLFDDLRRDVLGPAVRLEQERISYGWINRALDIVMPRSEVRRDVSVLGLEAIPAPPHRTAPTEDVAVAIAGPADSAPEQVSDD